MIANKLACYRILSVAQSFPSPMERRTSYSKDVFGKHLVWNVATRVELLILPMTNVHGPQRVWHEFRVASCIVNEDKVRAGRRVKTVGSTGG